MIPTPCVASQTNKTATIKTITSPACHQVFLHSRILRMLLPKEGWLYLTFVICDLGKVTAAWKGLKESGCSNCSPTAISPHPPTSALFLQCALLVSNASLQFAERSGTLGAQDVLSDSYCRLKEVFCLFLGGIIYIGNCFKCENIWMKCNLIFEITKQGSEFCFIFWGAGDGNVGCMLGNCSIALWIYFKRLITLTIIGNKCRFTLLQ